MQADRKGQKPMLTGCQKEPSERAELTRSVDCGE